MVPLFRNKVHDNKPDTGKFDTRKVNKKYVMNYKVIVSIAVICAILITTFFSYLVYTNGDTINAGIFGYDTILDSPDLVHALQQAQASGATLAIHGWLHENFNELTPSEAKNRVYKSRNVFISADLNPDLFIAPYEITGTPESASVVNAIVSTGTRMDNKIDSAAPNEYTWLWRDMKSTSDPRFANAEALIRKQQPSMIVLHVQDWNQYTKKFLVNYLDDVPSLNHARITIRMDDINVNTPPDVINDINSLNSNISVKHIILAVIPAGVKTDDPSIYGFKVNSIMNLYFLFFILTALLPLSFTVSCKLLSEWNDKRRTYNASPVQPNLVTVIVPAYNESASIKRCVEALLNQDYTGATEIIVINDGSTDDTAAIVASLPVRFINLIENGGKANALNVAMKQAKGDVVIFSDGDSNMSLDAISCIVKTMLENPEAEMVTGNVLVNKPNSKGALRLMFMYFQMIEYHLEQHVARHIQALNGKVLVCPGPITAVKRGVCDVLQFSDDTVVEDADFTVTALVQGMKVIRDPKAKVYTNAPESVRAWVKQRNRWWYGNLQVWKKHHSWCVRNPWMVYNYFGYISSTLTLIMIAILPLLIIQYHNVPGVLVRSLLYTLIPVLVYAVSVASFFKHDKKLVFLLIPYMAIYTMFRHVVLTNLYVRYITKIGLDIKFGSRKIRVK